MDWLVKKVQEAQEEQENIIKSQLGDFEKARSGIYADTFYNRKKGIVGQKYGGKKKEEVKVTDNTTYTALKDDLEKMFKKTNIEDHLYNKEMNISASGWNLSHPDGSIGVTFWLMDNNVDKNKLDNVAKSFAKKYGLVAATLYKDGIVENKDPGKTQIWSNKAAQNAKYIYGFTFYKNEQKKEKIYKKF